MSLLKLDDVHTFYGPIEAVRGVNIVVEDGEIVCLIGSNGAGKSTILMTISGILKPSSGNVYFEGKDIGNLRAHQIVGLGISQVPEGRRIFPRLTVMENLEMGEYATAGRGIAEAGGLNIDSRQKKTRRERVFDLFPVLGERRKQAGGTLSGGEQQMLAIGRAIMSDPKLLLLDEPSLGLAPIIVSKILRVIRDINRDGVTILLVEQNAHAALGLSKRGYVLENGRIIIHGTGEELLGNEKVKKAYLGE